MAVYSVVVLAIVDQELNGSTDDSHLKTLLFVPVNVNKVLFAPVQTVCPPPTVPAGSSKAMVTKTDADVSSQLVLPFRTLTL